MYKTNFDFIVEKAKKLGKPLRVAVVEADCENILQGAFEAEQRGIVELTLVGNEERITKMLKDLGLISRSYTIVAVPAGQNVTQTAIDLVHAGKADALMRGNVQTRDFLLPIIDGKNNLRTDKLITQVTLLNFPGYDRLLAISDVTVVVQPDLAQRKKIVQNMAGLLKVFGYEKPNIALLSMTERPAFHMPDTVEAQTIVHDQNEKPFADANLVGPISYDLIVSKEAARLKGYDCPYSGEFDGIVVPTLLTGNVLVKALQMNGHASACGVVVGAKVPIALTSRSDTPERAFLSLCACAAMAVDENK